MLLYLTHLLALHNYTALSSLRNAVNEVWKSQKSIIALQKFACIKIMSLYIVGKKMRLADEKQAVYVVVIVADS